MEVESTYYLLSPLLLLKVKVSSVAIDCWPTEMVEGIFSYAAYRRQLLLLFYLLTILLIIKLCVSYRVKNLNWIGPLKKYLRDTHFSRKNDYTTPTKTTSGVKINYDTQNCDIVLGYNLFNNDVILHWTFLHKHF